MNKIETVMKKGFEEFNELHTVSITLQSGMMLGNTTEEACLKSYEQLEEHFKAHQKDLLAAVVAEVKEKEDIYLHIDCDPNGCECLSPDYNQALQDIETLINNSTGV